MGKINFALSLLFLSSVKAFAINFEVNEQGYCPGIKVSLATTVEIVNPIDENSLEYRLCERMFPNHKNRKSIQSNKYGVPSNVQNYDAPVIRNSESFSLSHVNHSKRVNVHISEDGNYPTFSDDFLDQQYGFDYYKDINLSYNFLLESNDWDGIYELNRQAANVWRAVLSKSDLHHDYDSLKNAYIFNKKLHSKRRGRKEIDELIFNYQKSVLDFLSSSGVRYTYGASLISEFHPFFMQTIIEFYSESFISSLTDKRRIKDTDLYSYSKILYASLFVNEKYDKKVREIFQISSSAYQHFEYQAGILSLINMAVANKNCFQLGLKPELSRSIISSMNNYLYSTEISNIFKNTQGNLSLNCGKTELMGRKVHSILYNAAYKYFEKDILNPYRKKAVKFFKKIDWAGY